MKKKIIVLVVSAGLLFGGGNVYANSNLDTQLATLIKSGINNLSYVLGNQNEKKIDAMGEDFEEKIVKDVASQSEQYEADLKQASEDEVQRAGEELETYYQEIIEESKRNANEELDEEKNKMTEKTNQKIEHHKEKMKEKLLKEIEKTLKN